MSTACWCCLAALLAVGAAACGGGSRTASPTRTAPGSASVSRCHVDTPAAKRWLPRLHADIAAIRRATTHDAASRATDRFIAHLERSGVSLTTENRLIDLAVAASLGLCHDCFEALEAMRPIPSLAGHGCR